MKKRIMEESSVKIEEVTLVLATETYQCLGHKMYPTTDHDQRAGALDQIISMIEEKSDPPIKVVDYSARDLVLSEKHYLKRRYK